MPAGGEQRKRAIAEIDQVVVHAYRLKLIRELKLKKKLADKEVEGAASKAGDLSGWGFDMEDDSAFVGAVVENLGVGDAFTDEVEEVEAEEEAEEDEEEEEDGEDNGGYALQTVNGEASEPTSDSDVESASHSINGSEDEESSPNDRWRPPIPQRSFSTLTARPQDKDLPPIPLPVTTKKRRRIPKAPTLVLIPEMVPLFVEMVQPLLRPARTASASSHVSPTSNAALSAMLFEASQQTQSSSPLLPLSPPTRPDHRGI